MDREEKLKVLKELGGISEEDFDQLYITGIEDINNEFKKLKNSYGRNDIEGFRMAVHAIKGISGNYRIKNVNETCKSLGLAARENNNLAGVNGLIKKLEDEIRELQSE